MRLQFLLIIFVISYSLHAQNATDALYKIIENQEAFKKSEGKTDWPSYSDKVLQRRIGHLDKQLKALQQINSDSLSSSDQINKEMLHLVLEDELFNLDYQSYLMPLNAEGGFLTGMVYRTQRLQLKDEQAKQNYLKRLKAIPDYLEQQTNLLKQGLKRKKVVPKIIVQNCIG